MGNPALTDEQKEAKLKEMNGRRDDENNKRRYSEEHIENTVGVFLWDNITTTWNIQKLNRCSRKFRLHSKAMKRLFI